MDNKSGNENLNDDWLEKVSGGFSFEGHTTYAVHVERNRNRKN